MYFPLSYFSSLQSVRSATTAPWPPTAPAPSVRCTATLSARDPPPACVTRDTFAPRRTRPPCPAPVSAFGSQWAPQHSRDVWTFPSTRETRARSHNSCDLWRILFSIAKDKSTSVFVHNHTMQRPDTHTRARTDTRTQSSRGGCWFDGRDFLISGAT